MNAAIVAAMCAAATALYYYRRWWAERSYERHTREAIQLTLELETVDVPNPQAVIDRPPRPATHCPHVSPEQRVRATVRIAGTDMAVCSSCLTTAMRGMQDINYYAQTHGIRYAEGN